MVLQANEVLSELNHIFGRPQADFLVRAIQVLDDLFRRPFRG
jgi:hypothetical protein